MTIATMDFDWLLQHATVIAFDPTRPSLYVFALGMSQDALHAHVLAPMAEHHLFTVAQTQYIDAGRRERYRGQLPRVGMSLFEVAGQQFGLVLSYHKQFQPDLAQYLAWLEFWHTTCLTAAQGQA
jgi:hypothetical protein